MSCAHSFAKNNATDEGLSQEELVELLPEGTAVQQPSQPDVDRQIRGLMAEILQASVTKDKIMAQSAGLGDWEATTRK